MAQMNYFNGTDFIPITFGAADIICGTNKFPGSGNKVTVSHNDMKTNNYKVCITPATSCDGSIGEYWVENKTNISFDVKNTGENNTAVFDWILIKG